MFFTLQTILDGNIVLRKSCASCSSRIDSGKNRYNDINGYHHKASLSSHYLGLLSFLIQINIGENKKLKNSEYFGSH
jgi:hypothetical protein